MNETLPPKTCSIERLITKTEDIERALAGRKTAVRRGGRYADPGEIWEMKGVRFQVLKVYPQRLGDMDDHDAQQEGYEELKQYREFLSAVHPGAPFPENMGMWVHEFCKL